MKHIFLLTLLLLSLAAYGQKISVDQVGWLTGVGAPSATCSAVINNGAFYTDSGSSILYQCYPVSSVYTWHAVSGSGASFLPLTGGTLTGPLNGPAVNGVLSVGSGGYATIAAAYAAGPSTGVEVVLAGDITISSSQTISVAAPKALKLNMAGHTINCTQASGFCLAFSGNAGSGIQSLEIGGNGSITYTGAATSGVLGLQIGTTGIGYTRYDVHDLYISGFPGAGSVALNLVDAEDGRIDTVNFIGDQLAIQTDRTSNQNSFTNNHCNLGVNCLVNTGYKNTFRNNLFESNTGTYVVTESGVQTDYKENWWENNTDGTSASRQILFTTTDPSYSLYAWIEGNIFAGCTTGGPSCNSSFVYGFAGNGQQGIYKFSGNWYNTTMGVEQGFPNAGPQTPEIVVEDDKFPIYDVALDAQIPGYQAIHGVSFCPLSATACYQIVDDGVNLDFNNLTTPGGTVTTNFGPVPMSWAAGILTIGTAGTPIQPNFYLGNAGNAVQYTYSAGVRWLSGIDSSLNFFISYDDQTTDNKFLTITNGSLIGLLGNTSPSWALSGPYDGWGIDYLGVGHWGIDPVGITSGTVVTPFYPVTHLSGTASISTITPPKNCTVAGTACQFTFIPDGVWTLATGDKGVTTAAYTSGVSATGYGTCNLAFTGGGGSGATASIAVAANVPGAITITSAGNGFTSSPTAATVSNGSLTCTGPAVLTSTIGGGIALAATAVVGQSMILDYDPTTSLWYPSYTGPVGYTGSCASTTTLTVVHGIITGCS